MGRGTLFARVWSLAGAVALLVAACAPAIQPSPSAVEPAETTAPDAPASPVPPTAASLTAPATPSVVADSPAARPAASPVVPAPSPSAVALGGPGGTIKIISSLARTGLSKAQTDSIVNAMRQALREVNGRVGGATIVYEDLDDATAARGGWDAAKEAENANRAVGDQDTMVYIGPFSSGAARVSIPILCPANLVMISPTNTYPGLTKKVPGVEPSEPGVYYPNGCPRNYTRVLPSDEVQGAVAASWARSLGATKAYILDDGEAFGTATAAQFNQTASKVGLQVVGGPESIDPRAPDYRALTEKIRAAGADIVYYGGISQNNAGKLVQDLRAILGATVRLMGADGVYEQAFLDAAGPAAENLYVTFGAVPPDKLAGRGAEWYQAYKRQFDAEPEAYAAYGYEAMKVALDAIRRAGRKDRAAIRDAVFATRDYAGVLGTWSFTNTGDTTLTEMSGRQITGGAFDDENAVTLQAPR